MGFVFFYLPPCNPVGKGGGRRKCECGVTVEKISLRRSAKGSLPPPPFPFSFSFLFNTRRERRRGFSLYLLTAVPVIPIPTPSCFSEWIAGGRDKDWAWAFTQEDGDGSQPSRNCNTLSWRQAYSAQSPPLLLTGERTFIFAYSSLPSHNPLSLSAPLSRFTPELNTPTLALRLNVTTLFLGWQIGKISGQKTEEFQWASHILTCISPFSNSSFPLSFFPNIWMSGESVTWWFPFLMGSLHGLPLPLGQQPKKLSL